jgi:hypothetical protein
MADLAIDHPEPLQNVMLVPVTTSASQAPLPTSSRVATPGGILNPFDPRQPLPNDQRDPLYLAEPQTWAQRNPNLGVQKQRPRAKTTDAAKATRKITAARNKANAALLSTDIAKQVQLQQTQIEKIAHDHSRKVSDIEKLITHQTNYRQTREPSLANALTHKKGIEMNEGMSHLPVHLGLSLIYLRTGKEVGNRATLAEIQQAKEDDPLYHSMGEKERKDAIDDLIAYRRGKSSNARVTNKGAARDVFLTMERIESEVRLPSALFIAYSH